LPVLSYFNCLPPLALTSSMRRRCSSESSTCAVPGTWSSAWSARMPRPIVRDRRGKDAAPTNAMQTENRTGRVHVCRKRERRGSARRGCVGIAPPSGAEAVAIANVEGRDWGRCCARSWNSKFPANKRRDSTPSVFPRITHSITERDNSGGLGVHCMPLSSWSIYCVQLLIIRGAKVN
jgi:hypothetical protein